MKINFKKIASVLTSTVMLSSTIGLAAAANYPAPFVKGGSADVAVVWGSAAAASDLVAVTDITSDLQAALATQTATAGTSSGVSASGDFVALDTPSSKLHLGDTVGQVFTRGVTKDDLPSLLASGTFTDNANADHDYSQKINVNGSLQLKQFDNSDYKEDTPTLGVQVDSGNPILTYSLEFTDNPTFDSLATSDLTMMGKTYYILSGDNSTLTLLDSANTAVVSESDTQKVTVGDKEYDVSISSVGTNYAMLTVNGETTTKLAEGDTYKLKGTNTYVGVKTILYNGKDTGISKVQFSIGNGKIVLNNGDTVEMNEDSISGLTSAFTLASSGTKLSKIVITWAADSTTFIAPDSSPVIPGFENVKLSFAGMTFPATETTTVKNDGDSAFVLDAPLKDGDTSLDVAYLNSSGAFAGIGKDSSHLLQTALGTSLTFDQTNSGNSFVTSFNDGKNAESYVLYTTSYTTESNENYTTFKKRNDDTFSQKVKNGDTITLNNVVLNVGAINKNAKTVAVTASSSHTDFHTMYTKTGMQIWLPFSSGSSAVVSGSGAMNLTKTLTTFPLVLSEADKDGNIGQGGNVTLTLGSTGSDFKTSVSTVTLSSGSSQDEIGSSNVYDSHLYSALATEVQHDEGPDQHTATVIYHGGESFGELVLTENGVTVSSDNTVTGGSVKKLGSVAVSDAEAASVAGKNLIVVGGSCVNSVAAQLLGSALCGADFQSKTSAGAGSFVIETFSQSGGKVATLVAGYNAGDTSNAAKYLTTQPVDTTAGKMYLGSSATSATLQTTNSTA
jgi:hypothetical protein